MISTAINKVENKDLLERGCFVLLLLATLLTRIKMPYTHYAVHDYLIPFLVLVLLSLRINTLKAVFVYHHRKIIFLGLLYLWMWCSVFLGEYQYAAVKFSMKYSLYLAIFIMFIVFIFDNQKICLYHRLVFYFLLLLSFCGVLEKFFPKLIIYRLAGDGGPADIRIASLMQNSNPFGVLMAFGAVLSVILFKKKVLSLIELCSGVFLFTITAFLSGSRNAIMTLVVGFILLLIYGEIRPKNFLIYVSMSVLLLFQAMRFNKGLSRLVNLSHGRFEFFDLSSTKRLQIWKQAFVVFSRHPVAGIGVGGFRAHISDNMFRGLGYDAHNVVLNIAADLGFIGLALSGAFMFAILKKTDFKESLAIIPIVMFFTASLFDFFDYELTFVMISLYFLAVAANSTHKVHA